MILTFPVSSDKEQITTLLHSYGKVLASHSMDDLLSLYTTDGVMMAPGFQPAVGSHALKSSYERIFSTIKLEIEFTIDEIVVMSDEWAFARTTAEGTKYWLKKGTQERHHNQEIFICRKEDGKWKIARYIFSSMKPLQ
ncbi:hypothetical protein N0V90_006182 [Kalmusia sp. IMI 367209]|nr:hypothetical protein N0V90_006182 [Kalmusia sp. IMI 367209]